jgi:hypothetical protein
MRPVDWLLGPDPKENTSYYSPIGLNSFPIVVGTDHNENTAFNNSPIVALWGIPHIWNCSITYDV